MIKQENHDEKKTTEKSKLLKRFTNIQQQNKCRSAQWVCSWTCYRALKYSNSTLVQLMHCLKKWTINTMLLCSAVWPHEGGNKTSTELPIAWLFDYLLAHPQSVRLDKVSDIILTNTGVPQGTVLTPFLFLLYTTNYRHSQPSCLIQKFSDNTAGSPYTW